MKKFLVLFVCVGFIAFSSCTKTKPVKTIENLKEGVIGESTASAKYEAFANKAREEGNDTIAKLFDAASKAEGIHAANHKKVLESLGEKMEEFTPEFSVGTTDENLESAIEGETYEINTMYPQFIENTKAEKEEKAEKSFVWAFDTEKKHQQFYTKALEALNASTENILPFGYAVCPICGNTYEAGSVDEKCAFCQTGIDKFIQI